MSTREADISRWDWIASLFVLCIAVIFIGAVIWGAWIVAQS